MKAIICDGCKKTLSQNEGICTGIGGIMLDLRENCNKKFEERREEYELKELELIEKRKKLYKKFVNNLKEIGIEFGKL